MVIIESFAQNLQDTIPRNKERKKNLGKFYKKYQTIMFIIHFYINEFTYYVGN